MRVLLRKLECLEKTSMDYSLQNKYQIIKEDYSNLSSLAIIVDLSTESNSADSNRQDHKKEVL